MQNFFSLNLTIFFFFLIFLDVNKLVQIKVVQKLNLFLFSFMDIEQIHWNYDQVFFSLH